MAKLFGEALSIETLTGLAGLICFVAARHGQFIEMTQPSDRSRWLGPCLNVMVLSFQALVATLFLWAFAAMVRALVAIT